MLEFLNIVWPQETALRIVICAIVFVAVYVAYLCVRLKEQLMLICKSLISLAIKIIL